MHDDEVKVRVTGSEPARPVVTAGQTGGRAELPPGGVVLRGARFEEVDFSGLRLQGLGIYGCTFIRCDFRKAVLLGSIGMPPRSAFADCRFDGADLRGADPGEARFERCTFDAARLDGWHTWSAEFVACRFAGRIHDVEFAARPPTVRVPERGGAPIEWPQNEFRGNDFREAVLDDVEFVGGIDLDAQLWPDDPQLRRIDVSPARIDQAEAAARAGDRLEQDLFVLRWLRGRYRHQPVLLARTVKPRILGRYLELLELADSADPPTPRTN